MNKEVRGTYDYSFDGNNENLIVKRADNKCATLGTNYDKVELTSNVQRLSKVVKQKASVVQPIVLNTYNKSMGGVEKQD